MIFFPFFYFLFLKVLTSGYFNNDNRLKYPTTSNNFSKLAENSNKAARDEVLREIEQTKNHYNSLLNQYINRNDPISKLNYQITKNELNHHLQILERRLNRL
ncbi:hypothetical protein EDEG_00874 [Edhazardia aedis USNM 41457]|uniref:Uncharacterized protein n=1 Tax=Edhazardia aedis (strain USNM 41457) TaxID=1003232 RepID=J9DB89_EDHAE|nr:hypothetical protein EDEG_00874 [Edhazardia aedis USNM 41457]|eukprot:EJW05021.1 hypothetical protein EDEG_00874 [Edhazardia aedis USNM 41457]